MGIRTDLMSLGAIGLGTAVAVVGTGALLVAGASSEWNTEVCLEVAEAPVAGPGAALLPAEVRVRVGCAAERVEVRRQVDEVRVRTIRRVEASRAEVDAVRAEVDAVRAEVGSADFQALLRELRADAEGTREISETERERIEAILAEARTSRDSGH